MWKAEEISLTPRMIIKTPTETNHRSAIILSDEKPPEYHLTIYAELSGKMLEPPEIELTMTFATIPTPQENAKD